MSEVVTTDVRWSGCEARWPGTPTRWSSPRSAGRTSTASPRPTRTTTCGAATSCRCARSSASTPGGRRSSPRAKDGDFELDLVTHDARKFFGLLLKKNGYVLEQLYSPLVVHTTPEHEELKAIARGCVTRHHSHHYFGFAETQWRLFEKERPRRVKPLLYVYRVLLTGIHLMRTGEVEANLVRLNEEARLPHVADLIARKLAGPRASVLDDSDLDFHRREYERLRGELEASYQTSHLPEGPIARDELNNLLVQVRMQQLN